MTWDTCAGTMKWSRSAEAGYHIFEPVWIIRESHLNAGWDYTRIYDPSDKFGHKIVIDWYTLFKNNYEFEIYGGIEPNRHDYYEPRVAGRYFVNPLVLGYKGIGIATDSRKPVGFYFVRRRLYKTLQ